MKIYNYNKDTKEFIGEKDANESPLEKGEYLIPANATITQVNPIKSGYARVYNETTKVWEYIEDNRETVVYDTATNQESKVDYLGAVKSGFTKIKPAEFDIWDTKTNAWVIDVAKETISKIAIIKQGIQSHIDTEALSLGFDDINSIAKYMGFANDYRADAEALAVWTAAVWSYVEAELIKMQAGQRTIPTLDEAIAELPIRV